MKPLCSGGQTAIWWLSGLESSVSVAQPRTDASAEHRARELRKIAECLLTLADEVESEERNRDLLHPRRAMTARRQNRCNRIASGLLLDTLAVGGPIDEQLRLILLSWKDKPDAPRKCFNHVSQVWRPLVESGMVSSTSNLPDCAKALRMIATGVAGSAT
jgi:hypothetical protein